MRKMGDWREYLIEEFAENQEEALGYLQASMECYYLYGNTAIFLEAVETVIESQGGVAKLAKQMHIEPQALKQLLSDDKALPQDMLTTLFQALGCRLTLEPLAQAIPATPAEAERVKNVA